MTMYIVITFLTGLVIGFGLAAAGTEALIRDGQLTKTQKWYEEDIKKRRSKRERKNRRK